MNKSAWKHWSAWATYLGISPWRFDTEANAGRSETGRQREAFILAGGLRFIYQRMRPRSHAAPAAQPQSALNVLLAVRRAHRDRGHPMVAMPLVGAVLRGIMRDHRTEHGDDSLEPRRKEPFTPAMLEKLTSPSLDGLDLGAGQTLNWRSPLGVSLFALICTLSECGFRKAEISQTSAEDDTRPIARRVSLSFRIGGILHTNPSAELLGKLQAGDMAILKPPASKADQFGLIWASSPIYLAWRATPRNACQALAAMVGRQPLTDADLPRVPLFSVDGRAPFVGRRLDTMLRRMLETFLTPAVAKQYSWHSFRIYLACALLAAGASTGQILALVRWLTEASLHIYARLDATVYSDLVGAALQADFITVRTTNIAGQAEAPLSAIETRSPNRAPGEATPAGASAVRRRAVDFDLALGECGDPSLARLARLALDDHD